MVGFGLVAGGVTVVNWSKLGAVVLSWVISPVFSLVIGFLMFKLIVWLVLKRTRAYEAALGWSPFFIGLAVFYQRYVIFCSRTPLGKSVQLSSLTAAAISLVISFIVGGACKYLIKRLLRDKTRQGSGRYFSAHTDRHLVLRGPGPGRQ